MGGGGFFKEVYNWYLDQIIHENSKNKIVGIIDDGLIYQGFENYSKLPFINSEKVKNENDIYLIISTGVNQIRNRIIDDFEKYNFETLIHPSSVISEGANYGKGNIFCPNSVVAGNAIISNFNCFNFNSSISHDCEIGNNNVVSPGVSLMGNCKIGHSNFFGANCVVIPNIEIGNNNTIGAGSVVIKSIGGENTIVGVPGRIIK